MEEEPFYYDTKLYQIKQTLFKDRERCHGDAFIEFLATEITNKERDLHEQRIALRRAEGTIEILRDTVIRQAMRIEGIKN